MNEEQKKWFENLKSLVNGPIEDSPAAYETMVNSVQEMVDKSPAP